MVVPQYPADNPRAALESDTAGRAGRYAVAFCLAIPGVGIPQESVTFDEFLESGDSLLEVAHNVRQLDLTVIDPEGIVVAATVGINRRHRLRDFRLEIDASGFDDAGRRAHDIVMPVLSRWSYLHDVAIATAGMQITELATESKRLELTMIGAVKAFSDTEGPSDREHQLLLSSYREGLSSAEPLWHALSLFKVGEGVWDLRTRRRHLAITEGRLVNERSERVPDDVSGLGPPSDPGALSSALSPYAGKTFRAVFDEIRESLRNVAAHLEPGTGSPLAQDSYDDLQRALKLIPALRWMSRQLLSADLEDSGMPVPANAGSIP